MSCICLSMTVYFWSWFPFTPFFSSPDPRLLCHTIKVKTTLDEQLTGWEFKWESKRDDSHPRKRLVWDTNIKCETVVFKTMIIMTVITTIMAKSWVRNRLQRTPWLFPAPSLSLSLDFEYAKTVWNIPPSLLVFALLSCSFLFFLCLYV